MSRPAPTQSLAAPLGAWLDAFGLAHLGALLHDNGIAEDVITSLTEADLEKLGLSMGDRKRLMRAIASLASGEVEGEPVPPLHTERRQLTIMFCDLVDATALCTRLSPEQWRQVVLAYQQAAVAVITRCGGAVAQYLGDGLLVYFGYPQAQEDAAVRAVQAALALVQAIPALDIQLNAAESVGLHLRIGVDTGLVVIGDIGAGPRREQLALGDSPHIAARLQALARPDTVLISNTTRQLAAAHFTYEDQGVHALKGVRDPCQVWRVTGQGHAVSRFDATRGEHLSPLVGRVQELGLLTERWQAALQGQGQVVLLSGEAGIGKSRMLKELRDRLGNAGLGALQFQCSPQQAHNAFHPVAEAMAHALKFKPGMDAALKRDRIAKLVQSRCALSARHAALMSTLLGVPLDAGAQQMLGAGSAHQREQDTVAALADLLGAMAEQTPLLLLFEDAHWADPASVTALGKLVEHAKHQPWLLVVTHRPEFAPTFEWQGHVTALKVPGLRRSEVAALVSCLVGERALPAALAQQIESRTDGVPLFVEELTKTLLEQTAPLPQATPTGELPATLRDSLMARLDRHVAAREVAQVGAVIGREFSHELLAAVFPGDEVAMAAGIDALLDSGLALRQDGDGGPAYMFKHALVQDTAYDSLLTPQRQALHAAIFRVLEARHAGTMADQPALLAHHAMAAAQADVAIPYWRRASEMALQRLALHEAAAHLQTGLQATAALPCTPRRDQIELQLHALLGTVHMISKGWAAPEVAQAYQRASQLASAADQLEEAVWPLWGLCVYHMVRGEVWQAQGIGQRMLTVARQSNSRKAWLVANMMHSQLHYYLGQTELVQGCCEQVEHGYNDPQDRNLIPLYSTDLKLVAMVHGLHARWIRGEVSDVDQACAVIDRRAAELDHPYSLAWALTWGGMVYLHAARPDRLQPRLVEGLRLAEVHGFAYVSAMARFGLGWCQAMQGQPQEGVVQMAQGLAAFQATGAGIVLPFFLSLLAEAQGLCGQHEAALCNLAQARALSEQGGERWYEAPWHRIQGDVWRALPQPDFEQARASYQQAIEVAQAQQARHWLAQAATALASLPAD